MDWQPGDLALCVRWRAPEPIVRVGGIYTVRKVWYSIPSADNVHVGIALDFVDIDRPQIDRAIDARCFRKIAPHTEDAFDREVIEALKSEPVHVPQHDALHNSCKGEVSGEPFQDRFPANGEWRGW